MLSGARPSSKVSDYWKIDWRCAACPLALVNDRCSSDAENGLDVGCCADSEIIMAAGC